MTLDYLSEIEREKIVSFNEDLVLVNAVRKVLLEAIYNNGVLRKNCPPDPTRNAALGMARLSGQILQTGQVIPPISNEELGADLRALSEGVNLLEQGLLQLAKIKKDPSDKVNSEVNEAI